MLVSRLSLDLIIHQSRDVVLKLLSDVSLSGLVGAFIQLHEQLIICLYNLLIRICQVVLTSV